MTARHCSYRTHFASLSVKLLMDFNRPILFFNVFVPGVPSSVLSSLCLFCDESVITYRSFQCSSCIHHTLLHFGPIWGSHILFIGCLWPFITVIASSRSPNPSLALPPLFQMTDHVLLSQNPNPVLLLPSAWYVIFGKSNGTGHSA